MSKMEFYDKNIRTCARAGSVDFPVLSRYPLQSPIANTSCTEGTRIHSSIPILWKHNQLRYILGRIETEQVVVLESLTFHLDLLEDQETSQTKMDQHQLTRLRDRKELRFHRQELAFEASLLSQSHAQASLQTGVKNKLTHSQHCYK